MSFFFCTLFSFLFSFGIPQVLNYREKQNLQPFPLYRFSTLSSCCEFINDPDLLLQCTTSTINLNYNSDDNKNKNTENVTIVTYYSKGDQGPFSIPDIKKFSSYQSAILATYATHHNYILEILNDIDSRNKEQKHNYEPNDVRWNKIKILYNHIISMEKNKPNTYLVWVDADAIILDMSLRIEPIVEQQFPLADIIASADIRMGYLNSGFMIIRNTEFSKHFFLNWWSQFNRTEVCDQDAFDLLYLKYHTDDQLRGCSDESCVDLISNKIKILPMNSLNTHPPAMIYQLPSNQILHLMGESTAMRQSIFKSGFQQICRSGMSGVMLPPQLGLHRDHILHTAAQVYADETERLLRVVDQNNNNKENINGGGDDDDDGDGDNDNTIVSNPLLISDLDVQLRSFEDLSKAAHHLCDIYATINSDESHHKIWRLRKSIFRILLRQIERVQDIETIEKQDRQKKNEFIVGFLKRAAEAGNDLFGSSLDFNEKLSSAQHVFQILQVLHDRLAEESRAVALHMMALMHQGMGILYYETSLTAQPTNNPNNKDTMAESNFDKREEDLEYINSAIKKVEKQQHQRDALHHLKESVAVFKKFVSKSEDSSTKREYAFSLQLLATVYCVQGDYERGAIAWEAAIDRAKSNTLGIEFGTAFEITSTVLYNAGVCLLQKGDLGKAEMRVVEAISIREKLKPKENKEKSKVDMDVVEDSENGAYLELYTSLLQKIRSYPQSTRTQNIVGISPLSPPNDMHVHESLETVSPEIDLSEWEECEEGEDGCEVFYIDDDEGDDDNDMDKKAAVDGNIGMPIVEIDISLEKNEKNEKNNAVVNVDVNVKPCDMSIAMTVAATALVKTRDELRVMAANIQVRLLELDAAISAFPDAC